MEALLSLLPKDYQTWLAIFAVLIATTSAIAQALETLVGAISTVWPEASKSNRFLLMVIKLCSTLQASPFLQGLSLAPLQGAPSHPVPFVATSPGGGGVNLPTP